MQLNTKILVTVIFSFFALKTSSQSYKFLYHLDKDLGSTSKEKAIIIGKGYERNGSLILDCFLKTTEKKILSATVKDSTLSTLHGMFISYYDDMKTESAGNYFENEMEGVWKYWDKDGYLTDSVIYKNGIRVAYGKYEYYFIKPELKQLLLNPNLTSSLNWYSYTFTDSLKNTFTQKEVGIKNGKEKIMFQADFLGNRGLLKEYDSTGAFTTDSVFSKKFQEAKFTGGEDGWRDFLKRNLKPNTPVDNNAGGGKYTVIVKFIVNKDGTLDDIEAENDPGYGMAEEAIRVIKQSGKWQPAIIYGKYRKAYRRQPITFVVEDD
jgi:antitoxin component YwqK of YwqJK toxin-antitoxin module